MQELLASAKAAARALVTLRPTMAEYEEEIIFTVLHAYHAAHPPVAAPALKFSQENQSEQPPSSLPPAIIAVTDLPTLQIELQAKKPAPTKPQTLPNTLEEWVSALDGGQVSFRMASPAMRLALFNHHAQRLALLLEPGAPLQQELWNNKRPSWMPRATGLTATFKTPWTELAANALTGFSQENQPANQVATGEPANATFSQENPDLGATPRHRRADEARQQIPFSQFDALARKEIKRLSTAGVMCGPVLWNSQRDIRLPDWVGLLQRYQCVDSTQLARALGYTPPLGLAVA